MPPYRHSDNVYLYNVIKMMEQHMHKQLFCHQCKMYITVSYNRDFAEFNGTTALCIYVNKIIKFFNTVLYYATPFGDSPFAEVVINTHLYETFIFPM